jgi:hypothetical protein
MRLRIGNNREIVEFKGLGGDATTAEGGQPKKANAGLGMSHWINGLRPASGQ